MNPWLIALAVFVVVAVAGSWYARRAGRRALLHYRARVDRFKLASRKSVRERLLNDPAIHAAVAASVSELKKNPMGTVAAGEGFPVAILNRNEPAFYCVPAKAYEAMLERLEDLELNAIADARQGQAIHKVALDEL